MPKSIYANLRPKPENLGVTPLREGETTQTMRIRSHTAAVRWAAGLSAAERGAIFAAAHLVATSTEHEHSPTPIRLELGSGIPSEKAAHHGLIVQQLKDGGNLERIGKLWRLTTADGEARTLNQKMIDVLLRLDVLRSVD
ncbi:hypothetical protein FNU79_18570 [Deinococcus detaillensis]|uniref:Uncharacterized protein n=1 Tax=Deinococcus detaillensis TaxID=2592048 RepID=A0A553UG00_9DEIO|nr:hypothetical protein [Deinococcus detaillensis]TSA78941.1 hypothetical protein FNU79_18570 [Deinococcus detaillensis]